MTQFLFRYYAVKGFTYLVIIGRVCICSLKSYWKQALRSKTHFKSIKTYKIKKFFISLFFYLNFRFSGWDLINYIFSACTAEKCSVFRSYLPRRICHARRMNLGTAAEDWEHGCNLAGKTNVQHQKEFVIL